MSFPTCSCSSCSSPPAPSLPPRSRRLQRKLSVGCYFMWEISFDVSSPPHYGWRVGRRPLRLGPPHHEGGGRHRPVQGAAAAERRREAGEGDRKEKRYFILGGIGTAYTAANWVYRVLLRTAAVGYKYVTRTCVCQRKVVNTWTLSTGQAGDQIHHARPANPPLILPNSLICSVSGAESI